MPILNFYEDAFDRTVEGVDYVPSYYAGDAVSLRRLDTFVCLAADERRHLVVTISGSEMQLWSDYLEYGDIPTRPAPDSYAEALEQALAWLQEASGRKTRRGLTVLFKPSELPSGLSAESLTPERRCLLECLSDALNQAFLGEEEALHGVLGDALVRWRDGGSPYELLELLTIYWPTEWQMMHEAKELMPRLWALTDRLIEVMEGERPGEKMMEYFDIPRYLCGPGSEPYRIKWVNRILAYLETIDEVDDIDDNVFESFEEARASMYDALASALEDEGRDTEALAMRQLAQENHQGALRQVEMQ